MNIQAHWGAVFDWDGVIIDSSRHHEESWIRLAAEASGRVLPEGHFKKGFGRKNEWIIPHLLGWSEDPEEIHRLSLRKEALYREIVAEWGIAPLPGVREWLERLHTAGVPCVVGSSTHRMNIESTLERMSLRHHFQEIVTAEDVAHGKPDPEVFLKAAAKIGVIPGRCVVFEDAYVGMEAARRAGMKLVAVATTHPAAELQAADRVVHRLDELQPGDLARWF